MFDSTGPRRPDRCVGRERERKATGRVSEGEGKKTKSVPVRLFHPVSVSNGVAAAAAAAAADESYITRFPGYRIPPPPPPPRGLLGGEERGTLT